MTKDELLNLADTLSEESQRRDRLGDYSQEAAGIRFLYETVTSVVLHLAAKERK